MRFGQFGCASNMCILFDSDPVRVPYHYHSYSHSRVLSADISLLHMSLSALSAATSSHAPQYVDAQMYKHQHLHSDEHSNIG